MMTQGAFTLREAERSAKGQKLRIWQNYTPPASAGRSMASHAGSAWPHCTQLLEVGTDSQHRSLNQYEQRVPCVCMVC